MIVRWHTFDAYVHNTEILLDINQSNVARVTNRPNKNIQLTAIIFAEYRVCTKSKTTSLPIDPIEFRNVLWSIELTSIALLWSTLCDHTYENNISANAKNVQICIDQTNKTTLSIILNTSFLKTITIFYNL